MSKDCEIDFDNTCMGEQNARCVTYQGDLSECTELNTECRTHTAHEVIEDISTQLTKFCQDLDMSNVTMDCFDFGAVVPTLPELLTSIISKQCTPDELACDTVFNMPILCAELDYKCLYDECGNVLEPQNLKELFQSLINKSCEQGESPTIPTTIVEAGNNITVDTTVEGDTTTYTVNALMPEPVSKATFYQEVISDIDISDTIPTPTGVFFFPTGYNTLEYENVSTSTKLVEVHVSYETENASPIEPATSSYNDVESAIIKTSTGGADTIQYRGGGMTSISVFGYDVQDGQYISDVSTEQVKSTPGNHTVIPSFNVISMPLNTSYFKVLTLSAGEKVSLKFNYKDETVGSRLKRAQILVKEL